MDRNPADSYHDTNESPYKQHRKESIVATDAQDIDLRHGYAGQNERIGYSGDDQLLVDHLHLDLFVDADQQSRFLVDFNQPVMGVVQQGQHLLECDGGVGPHQLAGIDHTRNTHCQYNEQSRRSAPAAAGVMKTGNRHGSSSVCIDEKHEPCQAKGHRCRGVWHTPIFSSNVGAYRIRPSYPQTQGHMAYARLSHTPLFRHTPPYRHTPFFAIPLSQFPLSPYALSPCTLKNRMIGNGTHGRIVIPRKNGSHTTWQAHGRMPYDPKKNRMGSSAMPPYAHSPCAPADARAECGTAAGLCMSGGRRITPPLSRSPHHPRRMPIVIPGDTNRGLPHTHRVTPPCRRGAALHSLKADSYRSG